ncbi:MAG: InlB B-repeat-containing protein [Paludibacteraceae bacterium]|nr:InlB B-repeat-containing protein [Paludibacteraceae bacterium]
MKKIILSIAVIMFAVVAGAVTYMSVKTVDNQIVKYDIEKVEQVDYEKDDATSTRYMRTKTTDGKVDKYDVEKVVEVTYEDVNIVFDTTGTTTQSVSVSGRMNEYTFVDLGLESGLLWATYNVGATKPVESGDYFAWGETLPKSDYSSKTYMWCDSIDGSLIKYCYRSSSGIVDDKTVLDIEDDAATASWKGEWRMPTSAELQELISGCVWTWTDDFNETGVAGMIGTSNVNGNTIFFPAVGYYNGTKRYFESSMSVWSSSIFSNTDYGASYLYGDDQGAMQCVSSSRTINRYYGRTVRAVADIDIIVKYKVNFYAADSSLIKSCNVWKGGTTTTPKAPIISGYDFIGWSDSSFINVQKDIDVYAQYKPSLIENGVSVSGKIGDYSYVDLGLASGLKWATYNVGATKPEGYGNYFAWGETTTKDDYSWETYRLCEGTDQSIKKYFSLDKKTVLELEDDAAYYCWGENWCIPTLAEMKELLNGCNWKATDDFNGTGIAGFIGTSKFNGKVIFLPSAGMRSDNGNPYVGELCTYWSSTLHEEYDQYSKCFSGLTELNYEEVGHEERSAGLSIRAVAPKKYTVKFYNQEGTLIDSQQVFSGRGAIVPVSPQEEDYRFIGWSDSSFANVQKDIDVYAICEKIIYYTVNFYSIDSTLIESQKVEENQSVALVKAPVVEGFVFVGWSDTALSNVQRDIDVYALYILEENACKVNFYTAEKKLISSQIVGKGVNVVTPEIPKKMGYDFIGWSDSSFTNIQGDLDVYAQYELSNSGQIAGYYYVDLGLPSGLKWACYNVGATKRTESGDYFAWGETTDKGGVEGVYDWTNYKYEAPAGMTKYNSSDEKNVLDASDDAASVNWGSTWRMPTSKEMKELIDGCDWEWIVNLDDCGRNKGGMIGISKYNGKYIYFGDWESPGEGVVVVGGHYWSSNLTANSYDFADCMQFGTTCMDGCEEYEMTVDWHSRTYGANVRAVSK